MNAPSALLLSLIDALARQDAQDYLRAEAARRQAEADQSTERVPLPAMDKAA